MKKISSILSIFLLSTFLLCKGMEDRSIDSTIERYTRQLESFDEFLGSASDFTTKLEGLEDNALINYLLGNIPLTGLPITAESIKKSKDVLKEENVQQAVVFFNRWKPLVIGCDGLYRVVNGLGVSIQSLQASLSKLDELVKFAHQKGDSLDEDVIFKKIKELNNSLDSISANLMAAAAALSVIPGTQEITIPIIAVLTFAKACMKITNKVLVVTPEVLITVCRLVEVMNSLLFSALERTTGLLESVIKEKGLKQLDKAITEKTYDLYGSDQEEVTFEEVESIKEEQKAESEDEEDEREHQKTQEFAVET